jgi:predicted chitinase
MAKKTEYSWRIVRIRAKGAYVGTVVAATADEAIKKAIEEYAITDPQQQARLMAQRES